jgi:NAD+ kinase
MKTIGIVYNREKQKARIELERLKQWLSAKDCEPVVISSSTKKLPPMDFAITLGGDGTMLNASRFLAPAGIPVLGVNLGSLGFLAETNPDELYPFLEHILADGFQTDERMMLTVTLKAGKRTITRTALNDCIIHSGSNSRVIPLRVFINNEFLADYVGDGLIISTPTGSTAYALAASGPIVHPYLSLLVITPICPHTLAQRPMIVSIRYPLTVQVEATRQKPVLSLDGQMNYALKAKDTITITASPTPLRLILNPNRKYFDVLRAKLKWGSRG